MAGEDFPVLYGEGLDESSQTELFLFLWGLSVFPPRRPLQRLLPLLEHSSSVFLLVTQLVKNPPAVQETQVQPLGGEDVLEKETATHSRTLVWEIPWTREATVHGVTSVGHGLVTKPRPTPAPPVTFSSKAPPIVLSQSLGWGHPTCSL